MSGSSKENKKQLVRMTTRRTVITPKRAEEILANWNYEDNRKISEKWVDYLARQMTGGLWQLNGDTIVFDKNGMLLDGQHRLSAVVKHGKPVTFLVVRNIDSQSFTTMDQNRVRSAGQVFGMKGEKNGFLVAAICRKVYAWLHYGHVGGKHKISPDELTQVLNEFPEIRAAAVVGQAVRAQVPVDGSMVGFCYWLFSRSNKTKCEKFFETMESGNGSWKHDPAIILSRRFSKERAKNRRRWNGPELLAIFIRAWNYYVKGQGVKNLAIKPDKDGSYKVPTVSGLGRSQAGKKSRTL